MTADAAVPLAQTKVEGTEAVAILDGIRHAFTVPPGGHVVDAALAAGIRVPYACKGGMCCTCRAKVVEGQAEMTINYSLEPWEIERGFILTCQAVPKSDRLVRGLRPDVSRLGQASAMTQHFLRKPERWVCAPLDANLPIQRPHAAQLGEQPHPDQRHGDRRAAAEHD